MTGHRTFLDERAAISTSTLAVCKRQIEIKKYVAGWREKEE